MGTENLASRLYTTGSPPRDWEALWLELQKINQATLLDQGTFTATLSNGLTTIPNVVVEYQHMGHLVFMKWERVTATSDDATLELTGIPKSLWPTVQARLLLPVVDNNVTVHGMVQIGIDGVMDFGAAVTGVDGFTTSGTKGIEANQFSYMLKN